MTASMQSIYVVGTAILLATATPAFASSCWNEAASTHSIDPTLLKAIAWKESHGRREAIGPVDPKTGHRAYGMMQVYSVHLPRLAQEGITKQDLFESCTNQKVGARILADCIQRFGKVWKAVGCYNTGPASKNVAAQARYVKDVQANYAGYKRQEQIAAAQPDHHQPEPPASKGISTIQTPPTTSRTTTREFERASADDNS